MAPSLCVSCLGTSNSPRIMGCFTRFCLLCSTSSLVTVLHITNSSCWLWSMLVSGSVGWPEEMSTELLFLFLKLQSAITSSISVDSSQPILYLLSELLQITTCSVAWKNTFFELVAQAYFSKPEEKMDQSIQLKTEIAAPAARHGEDDEDDGGHGIDGGAALNCSWT